MRSRAAFALVGAGYWGAKLLRNLTALLGPDRVMVVESNLDQLSRVAGDYRGLTLSTDLDDALSDASITAVLLATPANTHHELARRRARRQPPRLRREAARTFRRRRRPTS